MHWGCGYGCSWGCSEGANKGVVRLQVQWGCIEGEGVMQWGCEYGCSWGWYGCSEGANEGVVRLHGQWGWDWVWGWGRSEGVTMGTDEGARAFRVWVTVWLPVQMFVNKWGCACSKGANEGVVNGTGPGVVSLRGTVFGAARVQMRVWRAYTIISFHRKQDSTY